MLDLKLIRRKNRFLRSYSRYKHFFIDLRKFILNKKHIDRIVMIIKKNDRSSITCHLCTLHIKTMRQSLKYVCLKNFKDEIVQILKILSVYLIGVFLIFIYLFIFYFQLKNIMVQPLEQIV